MNEGRDLAVTLIASALLLLGVSSLTQCSAASRPATTAITADAARGRETSGGGEAEREEAAGTPKSARELDEDEGQEERQKIQRVGHALQTIGANPEMRKTLGIPQ
jgi:hypothetical protein